MRITIVGTGYVGLVNGVALAEYGHDVTLFDVDEGKIARLNEGIVPIYEPGLEALIVKNRSRLTFTTDNSIYKDPCVLFIGVGTPEKEDGTADLQYLNAVIDNLIKYLEKDVVVVIKSTVPVGTNALVKRRFDQELVGKKAYVVSNPEFLAQGQAVNDALYPKRIVIGYEEPEVRKVMEEVYLPFSRQIVFTDLISSELSKYVCNNMLALKISFMNEIASLSDCVGADIECIKEIMQMDPRIGTSFLNPGIGYGGSCFPKDTIALSRFAKNELDLDLDIVNAGIKRNKLQKTILYRKAKERFGTLKGKNIALIGLTFKAGTDDLREAPSLVIIDALIKDGARVVAYDPLLDLINKKNINREVVFIKDFEEIVSSNDIIFLINDGLGLKPEMFTDKIVFDGRNNFKLDQVDVLKEYHSIGRKSIIN